MWSYGGNVAYIAFGLVLAIAWFVDFFTDQQFSPIDKARFVIAVSVAFLAVRYDPARLLSRLLAFVGKFSWHHFFALALVVRFAWVLIGGSEQEGVLWRRFGLAVLSAAQIGLLHILLVRLNTGRCVASAAAIFLTFWPEHILYCTVSNFEVPFALLILAAVTALTVESPSDTRWNLVSALASGLILGAAQWVGPTAFLFVLAAWLYLMLTGGTTFGRRILSCVMVGAAFCAVAVPHVLISPPAPEIVDITTTNKWNFGDVDQVDTDFETTIHNAIRYGIPGLWADPSIPQWSADSSGSTVWQGSLYHWADFRHALFVFFAASVLLWRGFTEPSPWDVRQVFLYAALFMTPFFLVIGIGTLPRYHHAFLPLLAMFTAELFRSYSPRE